MALYTENSLNSVITQTINNLDSIYSNIRLKLGGSSSGLSESVLGTLVSDYPTIIANRLWAVQDVNDPSWNNGGVLTNYTQSNAGITLSGVVYGTGTATISGTLTGGLGVYGGANSTVSVQINTTSLTISGSSLSSWTTTSESDHWTYDVLGGGSNATLLSSINLHKASLTVNSGTIAPTGSVTNVVDIDIANNGGLLVEISEPQTPANYEAVTLSSTSTVDASLSVTAQPSIDVGGEGYIANIAGQVVTHSSARNIGRSNGDINADGSTTETLYIKKGNLTLGDPSGGEITFTDPGEITTDTQVSGRNYYTITSTVGEVEFPDAQISEGYIHETGVEISVDESSASKYILAGSVENNTINKSIGTLENASDLIVNTNNAQKYQVKVGLTDKTAVSGVINDGYIKETSYSSAINIPDLVLNLPIADITNAVGDVTVSNNNTTSQAKTDSSGYSLALSVSGSISTTMNQEGYFKAAGTSTHNTALNKGTYNTLYIKQGEVIAAPRMTVTAHEASGDGIGGLTSNNQAADPSTLFLSNLTAAQQAEDYFTLSLDIDPNKTVTEGYIKSSDVNLAGTSTYYLPKAKVRWVDNGDGQEDHLEVSQAGYLPSGLLTEISPAAALEQSTVNAVLATTDTNIIKNAVGTHGAYTIAISKGTIDAGYISAGQGTLQLSDTYYINKGRAVASLTTIAPTFDLATLAWNASTSKYEMVITGTSNVQYSSFYEGYVKDTDVLIDKGTNDANASATSTLQLNQAQVGISHYSLGTNVLDGLASQGGGFSSNDVILSSEVTAFPVNVSFAAIPTANKTVTAKITSAGYGAVDSGTTSEVLTGGGTVYIKAGSIVLGGQGNDSYASVNFSSDFATNDSGNYTIRATPAAVSITGSVDEGYIPGNNNGISCTSMTFTNNTLEVARGVVSVPTVATASLDLNPARTGAKIKANLIATDANDTTALFPSTTQSNSIASGVDYVPIRAAAQSNAGQISVTPGYVKAADVGSEADTDTADYYMERYKTTEADGENSTRYYNPAPDGIYEETTFMTAEKYTQYNIKVGLHANAIGTNVRNDLIDLQNRLAGIGS